MLQSTVYQKIKEALAQKCNRKDERKWGPDKLNGRNLKSINYPKAVFPLFAADNCHKMWNIYVIKSLVCGCVITISEVCGNGWSHGRIFTDSLATQELLSHQVYVRRLFQLDRSTSEPQTSAPLALYGAIFHARGRGRLQPQQSGNLPPCL